MSRKTGATRRDDIYWSHKRQHLLEPQATRTDTGAMNDRYQSHKRLTDTGDTGRDDKYWSHKQQILVP